MKTINETFTEEEYDLLIKSKEEETWHDFILQLIKMNKKENVLKNEKH
jgi:hypothetical protein